MDDAERKRKIEERERKIDEVILALRGLGDAQVDLKIARNWVSEATYSDSDHEHVYSARARDEAEHNLLEIKEKLTLLVFELPSSWAATIIEVLTLAMPDPATDEGNIILETVKRDLRFLDLG